MKFALGLAGLFAVTSVACYEAPMPTGAAAAAGGKTEPASLGATPEVAPSKAVEKLVAAELPLDLPLKDVMKIAHDKDAKLPKDKDGKAQHVNVSMIMKAFSESLGVGCKDCHAQKLDKAGKPLFKDAEKTKPDLDYEAKTEMVSVAEKMWDEWVAPLRYAGDGSKLFCDSCHQGQAQFLDRGDEEALGAWMKSNFNAKLEREDGEEVKCGTCHGKPFTGAFLESWKGEKPNN